MPAMVEADRKAVWTEFMQVVSRRAEAFGALTKADLRAAVNALDDYLVTNASAINQAIPQPARGALTAAQKAELLSAVALKRYAKGA